MGWKVIISPSAITDLHDIVSYIARHNPDAALKVGNSLIARAEFLPNFSGTRPNTPGIFQP